MIEEFRQAMEATGLNFSEEIIPDGKLHRVHVEGDKARSKNAWYILHDGELAAGAFGCWKRDISEKWSSKSVSTLTPAERTKLDLRMEEVRKERKREKHRVHAECRQWCNDTWQKAEPATASSPYLDKKGILACGVKEINGKLLVPVHDSAGAMHGIQFISPDGIKKFKSGTVKHGNYFSIGTPEDNTLLIAEGYATAASLCESTGYAVAVAFDAGNLLAVAKTLRKKFPGYRLILCGDNDDSGIGQKAAREAALAVGGFVAVPGSVGQDFNDLHQNKGAEAVLDCVNAAIKPTPDDSLLSNVDTQHQTPVKSPTHYSKKDLQNLISETLGPGIEEPPWPFIRASDLSLQPRAEIVKGFLPANALVAFNGQSGGGKTFLVLDLMACVAANIPWHGFPVKMSGPVVFVPGEGMDDINIRLEAWCQHNDISRHRIPFYVSMKVASLADESELEKLMDGIRYFADRHGKPLIVAFDTLSRNIGPADENSSKDMAGIVRAADMVREVAGSTIIFVHHTGHGEQGRGRGSSVLPAALDANFLLKPDKEGLLELSGLKNKTGPAAAALKFKLTPVGIGIYDDDDEEVNTCVIEPGGPFIDEKAFLQSGQNKIALDALEDLLKQGLAPCSADNWRDRAIDMGITSSENAESKRKAFQRAKRSLLEQGVVVENPTDKFALAA